MPKRLFQPPAPSTEPSLWAALADLGSQRPSLEPSLVHSTQMHQIGLADQGLDGNNFALNFTFF